MHRGKEDAKVGCEMKEGKWGSSFEIIRLATVPHPAS